MTLEELKQTPHYKILSPPHQRFVDGYVKSEGDPIEAARQAYKPASDQSARSLANKALLRSDVAGVLNLWHGESQENDAGALEAIAWTIARDGTAPPASRIAALTLIARIRGVLTDGKKGASASEIDYRKLN